MYMDLAFSTTFSVFSNASHTIQSCSGLDFFASLDDDGDDSFFCSITLEESLFVVALR